jgi:transcriptional regulator with XRE-family HTH domain
MNQAAAPVPRPGIGIAIDRRKLKALREAALLERIDLSELSQITELREMAADHQIPGWSRMDYEQLADALKRAGVALPRHIGISRDAIAKIENGDRLRPKISTLRLLIDTLNTELNRRGMDTIGVEDLYPDTDPGRSPTLFTANTLTGATANGPPDNQHDEVPDRG